MSYHPNKCLAWPEGFDLASRYRTRDVVLRHTEIILKYTPLSTSLRPSADACTDPGNASEHELNDGTPTADLFLVCFLWASEQVTRTGAWPTMGTDKPFRSYLCCLQNISCKNCGLLLKISYVRIKQFLHRNIITNIKISTVLNVGTRRTWNVFVMNAILRGNNVRTKTLPSKR